LPRDAEIFAFQGSSVADVHAVIELARDRRISSPVVRYPLSEVADAYAAMESGTLTGRAVVVPGDTG
jgi:propanol-preferring alcohol dehydrogenase